MHGVPERTWYSADIMTKVLAINGSPRKDGNTSILIRLILKELENEGIETEIIQLGGKKIHGCTSCMKCFENRDRKCVIDDDLVNTCIEKMSKADGIIFGSPVYFLDMTSEMKALIDRAGSSHMRTAISSVARLAMLRLLSGVPVPAAQLIQYSTSSLQTI